MFRITGYAEGKMKSKKEIKAYIKRVEDEYKKNQITGGRVHEANIQNASILWALNWILDEDRVEVVNT